MDQRNSDFWRGNFRLVSRDDARRTGKYVDADVVVAILQRKLEAARAQMAKSRK